MAANLPYIEIHFDGFWLCRLATDPDPSLEERGISGFTFAVAGEDLLDPSIFTQLEDVEAAYGYKSGDFLERGDEDGPFAVKNIRRASPDYKTYNSRCIGLRVTKVLDHGERSPKLERRLRGMQVRFTSDGVPGHRFEGPIFEGRNQLVSDGDPDRFTMNPLVFQIRANDPEDPNRVVVQRYDPLVLDEPDEPLYKIVHNERYIPRWPAQRFAQSQILLDELGIPGGTENGPQQHFVNRAQWLEEKIAEAEAAENSGLAEAYRSRLFAVNFFTQATGPTVLENRLASRIPLRQLYVHELRGDPEGQPPVIVDDELLNPGKEGFRILTHEHWPILYYLGGYDGDLMSGWCTGYVRLPYSIR